MLNVKRLKELSLLADSVRSGDHLAIARTLSIVENDEERGTVLLDFLFPHTDKAHIIGITGAPGTGKSMLVNNLADHYRHPANGKLQRSVGIIAVDPTSPFTGGAILGDRVRMHKLAGDKGVFIRSMATRGALGGLAGKTHAAAQVMDAAGFEIIIIETVGAGQSEVDIVQLAHTVVVVETPGYGDDVQVIKAGILEIADIIVINKADLNGVDHTERYLRDLLDMAFANPIHKDEFSIRAAENNPERIHWVPPVHKTIALTGEGTQELVQSISDHLNYLNNNKNWQQRQRLAVKSLLIERIKEQLFNQWQRDTDNNILESIVDHVYEHKLSPHMAILDLFRKRE